MNARIWMGILTVIWASTALSAAFNVTQVQTNQNTGFGIRDVIQTPDRIYPGDEVSLRLSLYTTRVEGASNVVLTATTAFLDASNAFSIGNLNRDGSKPVLMTFTVPTGTKAGTYPVFFYTTENNANQQQVATIQLVVNEPTTAGALMAQAEPERPLQAGATGTVNVKLTNTGGLQAENVIVSLLTNQSVTYTALRTDRQFVARIEPGKTYSVPFEVGVSATAAPGYYPLKVRIDYQVDRVSQTAIQQDLGLNVEAKPKLLLTSDRQLSADGSLALTLTVANVGDTAVRGVYVKASGQGIRILGSSDKFIGTLNLDDSSTLALNVAPAMGGEQVLDVTVSYKDPTNQEHVLTEQLPITAGDLTANAPPGAARLRRGQHGGFLGVDLLAWAGVVALAVAAFFGYRWHQKRKAAKGPRTGGQK